MKKRLQILVLAVALTAVTPLMATRVRRLSLDELRSDARAIFVGQVVSSSTRLGDAGMTWTDYQVYVTETLKGETQSSIRTLSFGGGRVGEYDMQVEGVPHLEQGMSYLFFLQKRDGNFATPTLGWGQGLYRIEDVITGGVRRQTLISADGESLELDSTGKLVRGWNVHVQNGAIQQETHTPTAQRVAMTSLIAADGSTSAVVPQKQEQRAVIRTHNFATLQQLRDFVGGRLASGEPAANRVR